MAGMEEATGSVVIGKDALGSAGPPYPSCRNLLALGDSFSGDGVLGVGVAVC